MRHRIMFTLTTISTLLTSPTFGVDVATINGKGYTEGQYREELKSLGAQGDVIKSSPDFRKKFLDHLIDSEIMAHEAMKQNLDKSPEFLAKLAKARREILAETYLKSQLDDKITPKTLEAYFEKNRTVFSNQEVRASHILFDENDKDKAEKILKQALSGENFAELAKKHSIGPSGPNGGDLNFFSRGRMVPEFEDVAFKTPAGKVAPELVKTRFGWHIIKVTEIKGQKPAVFANKKKEVERQMTEEIKRQMIDQLRRDYKVEFHSKNLDKLNL